MAPKITTLQTSPAQISNQEFLTEVFGSKVWGRSHVCAFPEDPTQLDKLGKRHYWAGGEARVIVPGMADTDNTFFTISTFNPDPISGKSRRRKVMFEKSYVITIDDVGLRGLDGTSAKVPAEKIKLDPSYALETSPGNWQVGYLLKQSSGNGDDRGGKVAGLLEAMVAQGLVSDGSDPGMKGVTRYIRLPVGTNTKAKYGTGGFKHVLGTWKPELRYTLEQIADAYGVRQEFDNYDPSLGAGNAGTFDPDNDDIAKVLIAAGQVLSEDTVKKLWHVTCPFVADHSGRADSGTAYLGTGRWTCHHGHCEHRPDVEFNDKVREDHPTEWAEAMKDPDLGTVGNGGPESEAPSAAAREFADMFDMPVEAAVEAIKETKELGTFQKRMSGAFDAGSLGAFDPLAQQSWLLKGVMPKQANGVMYGPPGAGKSFVALDMLCHLACGMDWQGNRNKADPNARYYYVSSEGGDQEAKKRVAAWIAAHGQVPKGLTIWPGTLALGGDNQDAADFVRWAKRDAGSERVGMVVVDTLAQNMVGDENSTPDMNAFLKGVSLIRDGLVTYAMLIHHVGKDASKGSRGSTALPGDVSQEFAMEREFGVDVGRIKLAKNRQGQDGVVWGFELRTHNFGVDADGDAVTTKVVGAVAASQVPGASGKPKQKSVHIAKAYESLMGHNPGGYAKGEDVVKAASDMSRDGTFGKCGTNDAGYTASDYRSHIKGEMVKTGWVVGFGEVQAKGDWTLQSPIDAAEDAAGLVEI